MSKDTRRGRSKTPSGGAPVGNQNSTQHGIYGTYFTPEELALDVQIGEVDAELRVCRIRLRRALLAEKTVQEPELDEITEQNGDITTRTMKYKRRDFASAIDRLIGRIESLERTRAELNERGVNGASGPEGFEVVAYED